MHTDATLAALLRDVLDAPDDDAARLRYADRLDELEQPEHAEFVRVQIALEPWRNHAGVCDLPCSICNAMRREEELLNPDWVLPLARIFGISEAPGKHKGNRYRYIGTQHLSRDDSGEGIGIRWRRGFVECVTCTASDWLRHGDAIRAAQPVREVRLTAYTQQDMETVAVRIERLLGVRRLDIGMLGADMFRACWPAVKFHFLPCMPPAPSNMALT
jgi:uncharacterized protein (TIGR02996 family)